MAKLAAMLGAGWGRRRATDPAARSDAAVSGRHVVRWVIGCGAVVILGVILAVTFMIDQQREHVLQSTERELRNTVLLLARHFDQQISQIRDEQKDFVAQIRASGVKTPADFAREMSSEQTHAMLQDKVNTASDVTSMWIFDADGQLINTSEPGKIEPFSVGDQPSFQALKSPWSSPFTIELVKDHFNGAWLIVLARRVAGANGEFLGVVSMGILPGTLERFFASVSLGDDSSITMFKREGVLLARYPHAENMLGKNFRALDKHRSINQSVLALAERDGQAVLRFPSPVDARERLGAAQVLSEYPITLVATTTIEAALAGWHAQTRFQVSAAALSALVIAAMLYLIVRQISRQHHASRQHLAQEKKRLDTAINNMAQGLLMFDAAGRLIVCNQRYLDMFRLSGEVVKPGCTLRQLMIHRKAMGFFHDDIDAYCAWFDQLLRAGKPAQSTLEPGDGRSIQYSYQPLADGGWLTTVEDITARRRADARIAHLAHYDPLTDLPNRILFQERLEHELKSLGEDGRCAVLYL
ncbi:MAG: PAS-domain containing protein, partial [Xanthobacteraceae bacterium]